ncbi:hypothetical protein [Rufibacter latericius]|uniref:STAS/SEC14 domain-containing protein n=1 Tax=Rufibacter latericius TaxID=2487040 RepID=A0A3M9MF23_9BACT|nr:hypothetical protein [Rufibacter latericius]RNI24084.1 hypothetical protein EFB08_17065 [Rufibacter latericius]
MILFENTIIKLDYSPATDILEVAHPDLHDHLLPEIKDSIKILLENVRSYDVKRLLLDSSRTTVSVSEQESLQIGMYLAEGLMKTRLVKLARLQSPSPAVEENAEKDIREIEQAGMLTFELQNFTKKVEALEWLKG